ncbi:MAG: hypothetical protein KME64_39270 [Scytonematopsis contorta HA4267-MV1]|jgi:hypothetical protein|nr:hypothetical protein [Scytonematopsis contorta HA4267-MV1]
MTRNQGAVAANEQIIAQAEFEEYLEHQVQSLTLVGKVEFDIKPLEEATENIVQHAQWLAHHKKHLNKLDFKQLIRLHGWSNKEEKRYLKVGVAFANFSPQQLKQIEPATIYQLANQSKKYQEVIEQLQDLPEINQAVVRGLMESQRKVRVSKQEKSSIWRLNPDGIRYVQVPPIHEQETGVQLQEMMEKLGKTAQAVITDAVQILKLYLEGQLVPAWEIPVSEKVSNFDEPQEHVNIDETIAAVSSEEESIFIVSPQTDEPNINVNFDKELETDCWSQEAVSNVSFSLAEFPNEVDAQKEDLEKLEDFQVNDLVIVKKHPNNLWKILEFRNGKAYIQMVSNQERPHQVLVFLSTITLFHREAKASSSEEGKDEQ